MPRSDQRRRAKIYIRGLLTAPGRKTISNIASLPGGSEALRQSLTHLVSGSTWAWQPVRQALALHVSQAAAPRAWVAQPLSIPKNGEHSAGVDPSPGTQQVLGIWLAGGIASYPVSWRLFLSSAWLEDNARKRAHIADWVKPQTRTGLLFDALDEMTGTWNVPLRPVIIDSPALTEQPLVEGLTRRRLPFLIRISAATPLTSADPRTGLGSGPAPARKLAEGLKRLCRPTAWLSPADTVARSTFTMITPVTSPHAPGTPLVLVAEWNRLSQEPSGLWLSSLTGAGPSQLLGLSRCPEQTTQDFADVSSDTGITDYEGRSFTGWHRHTTLASIAHTIEMHSREEPPRSGRRAA
ncbi:transposase [Streptomyces sp. NPDC050636]|uniref:IS701 family transposase n=1 Tax=Streptomyces sp. NPDC050636 TaxID=3154510 RepID=UPI003437479D